MKKNKVYTKTGDDGNTSLISGKRVPKHDCRIKAYGSIDELNSWVGIIRSFDISKDINNELILIQRNLMTIASQLSNDSNNFLNLDIIKISNEDVLLLEQSIDNIFIPISLHVRIIRSAISPLLAINIFLNNIYCLNRFN